MFNNYMKIIKEVKESPFRPLKRRVYIGKLRYGCPYFYPIGYCPTAIKIRRLRERTEMERTEYKDMYPYSLNDEEMQFKNIPLVRRCRNKIWYFLKRWWYVEIGYPFAIYEQQLGWKDKYGSPRFEWAPAWYIFFFKWQLRVEYMPETDVDNFWEMYLWWKDYCDEDLTKAESTWGWQDPETKESTWDKNNLK
jgi:hypothetical protein